MGKVRFWFLLTAVMPIIFGCNADNNGEKLARQYCSGCHAFPDPSLLDKATWSENVLPEMAFRMGLNNEKLFKVPHNDVEKVALTLPDKPMVTKEEWASIVAYFLQNAPDTLSHPDKISADSITGFQLFEKTFPFYPNAYVTSLTIDTLHGGVFMGDRLSVLYQFGPDFSLKKYIQLESAPSNIIMNKDTSLLVSLMGVMDPNDQEKGTLVQIDADFNHSFSVVDSLQRPVYFKRADLNNDKEEDLIVCAFGNYTGQLLGFEKKGREFIKHIISSLPGARNVVLKDVNHDGFPDVLALMTQGSEKISLFLNKGNFSFQERVLLSFPPVYGSSYFEVADFNHDGHFDILYTNGDNADYSMVLKPYHGVKLYLNSGNLGFEEFWSYPMYGASQTRTRDFDQDGDLDIVAISFFPDFQNYQEESLIYFENKGDNSFKVQTSRLATAGRWLVLEAGDYDRDGDCDILVGAHNLQVNKELSEKWKNNPVAILVLKNTAKK